MGLKGPKEVVTYEVVARRTSQNANPIQVLCLASANEKRLEKLSELRDAIGYALISLTVDDECALYFEQVGTVESWPIMPPGSWKEVPLV